MGLTEKDQEAQEANEELNAYFQIDYTLKKEAEDKKEASSQGNRRNNNTDD